MVQIFHLPTIGDAMAEAEILEWTVAIGDEVEVDQVICSIETDKSVVELTSPYRGTVLSLGGDPGEVLEVGAPLIVVGTPSEADDSRQADSRPADSKSDSKPPVSSPLVRKLADEQQVDLQLVSGTGTGGRITRDDVLTAATPHLTAVSNEGTALTSGPVLAMPKVRRAARERGIDLGQLGPSGSGPNGAITLPDLDLASGRSSSTKPSSTKPERRQRLSAMRRSIAAHLTESVQTIPQFTSSVEVDVTALLATREALAERRGRGQRVPLDALLIRLLVPVVADHPIINAKLDGDEVVYFGHLDVGVAVDTADGLMVPVVRNADQQTIDDLTNEVGRLATAARDRTIAPGALGDQTFTVNNVGALGIVAGTPILPLGTSTIVAFGVARPVAQIVNGQAVAVPTMTISATFDHRLIDGGDSGRFLGQLKQHLEVPAVGLL